MQSQEPPVECNWTRPHFPYWVILVLQFVQHRHCADPTCGWKTGTAACCPCGCVSISMVSTWTWSLCNPLRKQHTQWHNVKLTSFRHKREILHWTKVGIKKKNKKQNSKEQGNERRNCCNDRHYSQRSVLFQRNEILRHAGSFDTLCLLMFQRGDAKAHTNEILNQANQGVFGFIPMTTKKSF